MTVVSSHNDWDPLEECFVGIADHARIPTVDKSTHSFGFADCKWEHIKDLEGPSPEWVIDCLLYTSPSPRDLSTSRMPSSA